MSVEVESVAELLRERGEAAMAAKLERWLRPAAAPGLTVGVAGEFNRGKSTLINALEQSTRAGRSGIERGVA